MVAVSVISLFKVRLSLSEKISFICFNGRSLNMIKNAINLNKLFCSQRYLKFCPKFFCHLGKRLDSNEVWSANSI